MAEVKKNTDLHIEVVDALVEKLKADAMCKTLFGDRIGTAAPTGYPALQLVRGKLFGPEIPEATLPGSVKKMIQMDARATLFTEKESDVGVLAMAVQNAMQTLKGYGPVSHVVLTDTGKAAVIEGVHQRTDLFGCFA